MTHRFAQTAAVLALAAFSTCAPAQALLQTEAPDAVQAADDAYGAEAPGRAGRISLVQGRVDIGGDVGAEHTPALLNWPVTSGNSITTSPGARTEIRVGSTSIRLDGDSSLEVTELDDDSLRLRLHYGSASIRVMNPDLLPEFELRTAQALVRLTQPSRLRVDAEKIPDVSLVSVLDGEAQVDGAGASLTVRGGRSAEVRPEDVRTLQARRDGFDDWALTRDQDLVAAQSTRYVGTEMTGYEELDRYGSWSTHSDYGSLWTPTVVADWTPYRDGRWSWIAPWGWTWVDNAPWGYAPFHYGRWVQVRNRWAWAPGRIERRPVWAPALVGWVGGAGWNVGFHSHTAPAHGWYPLTPYDRYVPGYRLSDERLRRLNDWRHAAAHARQRDRDDRRQRHGLTVVPREQFGGRGQVIVPQAPRPSRPPRLEAGMAGGAPGNAPPPPLAVRSGWNADRRAVLDRAQPERLRFDASRDRERQEALGRSRLETESLERSRADGERLARERADRDRLSSERLQLQQEVARQRDERERVQRDFDNRDRLDRTRFQVERMERDRAQRDRMTREGFERQQMLGTRPAPSFARPEARLDARPEVRPDPRPQLRAEPRLESRRDPRPEVRPDPRPAAPPQMVAPPSPRPQPAAPAFAPRGEGRAHTDARGRQIQER